MLVLSDFSKGYNGHRVLTFSHATFGPGLHWIQGANGSGKSTLFKSIAGLIPFSGSIAINTLDIRTEPVRYRKLVNFSEAEPLFPSFVTPKDLIRFYGKAKGSTTEQQDRMAEAFGITPYFTQPVGTFSSGMMKKVSLVMAFLGAPQVIILDEPLITLDQQARETLFSHIRDAVSRQTIVLMSSHQIPDGSDASFSSRRVIINSTLMHA